MSDRSDLIESIVTTTADYRQDESQFITHDHVDKWVAQFEEKDVEIAILEELDHVFKQTYYRRGRILKFIDKFVLSSRITGYDQTTYWKNINFLDIQKNGRSQHEMLILFDVVLKARFNLSLSDCGSSETQFLYLDDVLFSGNRIFQDLSAWIQTKAPATATVYIVVLATHTYGTWDLRRRLTEAARKVDKQITIRIMKESEFENRSSHKNESQVLWPTRVPMHQCVQHYLGLPHRFPFQPRVMGNTGTPFSGERGRSILEGRMVLAGACILAFCEHPKEVMRPLGFSHFGLGFGSTIVTYRNCPNNCPLAFWWGDKRLPESNPLSQWQPLFPRKTYPTEPRQTATEAFREADDDFPF